MLIDHQNYVPCIRWKQGEYQAMFRLSSRTKDKIVPLIEIPEMGFDFENWQPAKSIDEHLSLFTKRVCDKWGGRPCFIDSKLIDESEKMSDGRFPMQYVFEKLRLCSCPAIPVTGLNRNKEYQQVIREIISKDTRGLGIRISIDEAIDVSLKNSVDTFLNQTKLEAENCDLFLDLGAPNFIPIEGFSKLLVGIIRELPYLQKWRSFIIMGTAFPATMAEVERGVSTIPRHEWMLYKNLIPQLKRESIRLPTFGDYGISHPSVPLLDMRHVKPSANIRYAIDDSWLIARGTNVRVTGGYEQFHGLCEAIVASSRFLGAPFSQGDTHISECAVKIAKAGNLSTWRWVGTNHHVEKVIRDVSNFYASLGKP